MRGLRRAVATSVAAALALSILAIGGSSAGAQAAPRDPVIVVNGLFGVEVAYEALVARLRADGYQVWDFELPTLGTQDIHLSAQALDAFADDVRAQTGAAKVDLVGHSEGGLVARTYVKFFGGADEVDSLVTLGTPNRGTVAANIVRLFTLGTCVGITACEQMTIGSSFLADLNAGDDSIGDVVYTNIATVFDELVQPFTNSFLDAGDGNITNKTLQSQCWFRIVGHLGLIVDGAVYSGVEDALEKRPITFNCFAL
ncbi:MAG TPA: alpha/beta fold hydrolase [Acidimicrobiales bacterium]|nr:alpha/beta fold hydrolase [Acidimicrobiales bacterium]